VPRAPKPMGTAVDSRNGAKTAVAGERLEKFVLPKRPAVLDPATGKRKSPPWRLETRKAWDALWDDEALSSVLTAADRPVLVRWADALDRAARSLELADADPIAKGSMGQSVESPHYGIADKALRVAAQCEQQIGVGGLNRSRLGITILAERRSLLDLAAAYPGDVPGGQQGAAGGEYADPR
jgi:P27 family predicted phage terminase small subunit